MPTKKTTKRPAAQKTSPKETEEGKTPVVQRAKRATAASVGRLNERRKNFISRRPHRSFRRTRRRDYARSLKLPGYWAFTVYVWKTLWRQKKLFAGLAILYGFFTAVLVGIGSQSTYLQLSQTVQETGDYIVQGNLGELAKAGILLGSGVMGSLNNQPTELQRFYALVLALLAWLTTVWLLRVILAGKRPRLRDGLYNAGAPFLPTFLVSLLLVLQLLPVALVAVAFGAAMQTGLLEGGVEAMLFWVTALLLITLSLYWMVTTFMALVIVTLPGMYPMRAVRTAGDLVVGRRMRLLLRLLWTALLTAAVWAVVMLPLIMADGWLKQALPNVRWLPVVPVALLVLGSFTIVWSSSYVYLLYRKVVDDDTAPA